jgi:hypothetical protein
MIHAMLTSWMLSRPLAAVAALITADTFHNLGAIRHPVLTLQVRRSDKKGEDPFWNLYGGYRDLATYVAAAGQVAAATGKCFRTIIVMSDARHALLALRRMHAQGKVKICGRKPVLVYSRGVADDVEHSVPVFGHALAGRGRGGASAQSEAEARERLFAAELWLSARHSDFVLGDATSNVFLMLLEAIAARKRVADLPRLVRWDLATLTSSGSGGGATDRPLGSQDNIGLPLAVRRQLNAIQPIIGSNGGDNSSGTGRPVSSAISARCPGFNPVLHSCMWISSLGASFQMGWHSVLLNNPWINGEPLIVEYAMRLGPEEMVRRIQNPK